MISFEIIFKKLNLLIFTVFGSDFCPYPSYAQKSTEDGGDYINLSCNKILHYLVTYIMMIFLIWNKPYL